MKNLVTATAAIGMNRNGLQHSQDIEQRGLVIAQEGEPRWVVTSHPPYPQCFFLEDLRTPTDDSTYKHLQN
jgi:hypothetical protein